MKKAGKTKKGPQGLIGRTGADRRKKDRRDAKASKPLKPPRRYKEGERPISIATDDAEATFPPSEWMIPATDAHGHSAKVFCRCPPSYKHQIGKILQRRQFPWETESDLVRVAVHRLLNDVAKNLRDPDISSQQAILNSLVEMASRQMEYSHFKETLEKMEITVKELIADDAKQIARKMVRAVADQIESFEDPFWKTRYRDRIVKAFPDLLK